MASSSERGAGAARAGRLPPEEIAAFYALREKQVTAHTLRRYARAAELSDQAAGHAERLWGNNSLVVAGIRVTEVTCLRSLARASTSFSEQDVLLRRAWALLPPVHALLLRRLADDTLLPGTNKHY